jgi:hypothetical protein
VSEPGSALHPGVPVLLSLQSPKEKIWGLLLSIDPAGVSLRGLDLAAFDDWVRQEARGEEALIGLTTLFYPMHRLERLEMDETIGPLVSYADRFAQEVGRPLPDLLPRKVTKNRAKA